ncbi:MAG TPA: 4'-phosphopantetheinyl transferase superfamily protein [Chitinophagaceae bacterium]|nr:4'-phosphopantetheinyl transferase superfamily protein [Chitinophagaceae bacterium]
MPIFFQQPVSETSRLGIWKIEETEEFFKGNVPQHRNVTHPHKRLQHLAGRFLLQFLQPDFPYELIRIADTRKPFLAGERYHFSISHCGDYAAAIISPNSRVGVDIEIPVPKLLTIANKFLSVEEQTIFNVRGDFRQGQEDPLDALPGSLNRLTVLWSAKEAVFKWYGEGGVDFRQDILLENIDEANEMIDCTFRKTQSKLKIHYRVLEHLVLAWTEG